MCNEKIMISLSDHFLIKSDLEQKIKELVGYNNKMVGNCRREQVAHHELKREVTKLIKSVRPTGAPGYGLVSSDLLWTLLPLIKEQL